MQAIYDHISAVLVGATVLLVVGTITRGSLEAAFSGGEHHVARAQEMVLASILTKDLRNVGAAGADDSIVAGTDSTLEVPAPVERGDSAVTVRYERVWDRSVDGTPIYRLERYVDDSLTATIEDLAVWRVYCLDENGDTLSYSGTSYQSGTRAFAIELELVPGAGRSTLGSGDSIRRRWTTILHPFHLEE